MAKEELKDLYKDDLVALFAKDSSTIKMLDKQVKLKFYKCLPQ